MCPDNLYPIIQRCFQRALQLIEEQEEALGKLDAAAGDGDHGRTMVRGLRAANQAIETVDETTPVGALIMQAGSAFADAAGGASGPLFGMFLMTVGQKIGNNEIDTTLMHQALTAGQETIQKLGKSQLGDKTMLDTLGPFVVALKEAKERDESLPMAWQSALPAAKAGAESTVTMMARKGRASKLGERSIGHADPGAMSIYYLLKAVDQVLSEQL